MEQHIYALSRDHLRGAMKESVLIHACHLFQQRRVETVHVQQADGFVVQAELPPGVSLQMVRDDSNFIRESIE